VKPPSGGFSELFIRRAVATTLVMAGITLFGLVAYRALPVSDLPNIDMPTLVVTASLPGANPETMASAIATPLERQFSTIEGLDSMNSLQKPPTLRPDHWRRELQRTPVGRLFC